MLRATLLARNLVTKPATMAMPFRTLPTTLTATNVTKRLASTVARERPLSPHLEIYKFRVNMITSVFFRGTGIALSVGLAAGSIAYLVSSVKYTDAVYALQQYPLINAVIKFGVVTPLVYHYFGGLRHLSWDNVYGQNMKFVKQTGWGATAIAGAAGVLAMFVSSAPEHK